MTVQELLEAIQEALATGGIHKNDKVEFQTGTNAFLGLRVWNEESDGWGDQEPLGLKTEDGYYFCAVVR